MNKNELIADVASRADLTKEQAGAAIEATLDAITDTMKAGEEVRLLGFGNFVATHRPQYHPEGPPLRTKPGDRPFSAAESTVASYEPGK